MEFLSTVLGSLGVLLAQAPVYIVWLVGIAIAAVRYKRHPRVSLLAIIGLGGSLLLSIANALLTVILPQQFAINEVASAFAILGVCSGLIYMVLWGLILAAIFGWRSANDAPTNE
jgi:MFS family permease